MCPMMAPSAACSRPSSSLPFLCGCTVDSVAAAAVTVPRTNRQPSASAASSSSTGLVSAGRQIRQVWWAAGAMFSWILRGCRDECSASDQLKQYTLALQARDVFVAKEAVLQKKISQEVERAKEFTKSGNKQAAMQCLKRKKYYESQMSQVGSVQLRINTKEKMIADHTGKK
nr:unnamed protein product [Digitaria exilis]